MEKKEVPGGRKKEGFRENKRRRDEGAEKTGAADRQLKRDKWRKSEVEEKMICLLCSVVTS